MPSTASRSSTLTVTTGEDTVELLLKAFGGDIDLQSDEFHDKLKEAIESEEVKDKTLVAITDLNNTVKYITQGFRGIRRDLHSFDSKCYTGKGGTLLKLSPGWDELHKEFHGILDTSRDNATEAAAFMRQFTKTMLQDVPESEYPALKDELGNFMALLAEKEEKASKAQREFRELADEVHLFPSKIDEAIRDAEDHIKIKLDQTKFRIGELHVRLREVSRQTTQMAAACIASFATAAVGVGLAIVTLSPEAFALAITSAVAVTNSTSKFTQLLHEKKGLKEELKKCNKEAEYLGKRLSDLHSYKETIESTKSDMEVLSSQISTLVGIWQALKQDLHAFNEELGCAAKPNVKINKFFPKKIANTRGLYKTLICLLEEYAKGSIDPADEETLVEIDDEIEKEKF